MTVMNVSLQLYKTLHRNCPDKSFHMRRRNRYHYSQDKRNDRGEKMSREIHPPPIFMTIYEKNPPLGIRQSQITGGVSHGHLFAPFQALHIHENLFQLWSHSITHREIHMCIDIPLTVGYFLSLSLGKKKLSLFLRFVIFNLLP